MKKKTTIFNRFWLASPPIHFSCWMLDVKHSGKNWTITSTTSKPLEIPLNFALEYSYSSMELGSFSSNQVCDFTMCDFSEIQFKFT